MLMLVWQLETFKRTLMQSLQEDDENPMVNYSSFSVPRAHSLHFVSSSLKLNIILVVFRVKVLTSVELQIPIQQSEEHHVNCFFTDPSLGVGFNSLLSRAL
jgi:hypothetical protein